MLWINIPIIGFDSGVPDARKALLRQNATCNYEAGKLAAKETYALIKDKIEGATDVVRISVVAQESTLSLSLREQRDLLRL